MQEIQVSKQAFIQYTSRYLKMAEQEGKAIVITHHKMPTLCVQSVATKSIHDLRGCAGVIKTTEDINKPILPGFDEWSS
ncbi:MAG: hypothetical protein DHS20C10_13050 [marine bacterium B5-7]|nr:MAG: hypothetical protein DHS20C10_13050 [marine bacterium B5-7]